jgi:hypothetical protein
MVMFSETSTLGVRVSKVQRASLQRESVHVPHAGGIIAVKRSFLPSGAVATVKAEFDDCARVARACAMSLKAVQAAVVGAVNDARRYQDALAAAGIDEANHDDDGDGGGGDDDDDHDDDDDDDRGGGNVGGGGGDGGHGHGPHHDHHNHHDRDDHGNNHNQHQHGHHQHHDHDHEDDSDRDHGDHARSGDCVVVVVEGSGDDVATRPQNAPLPQRRQLGATHNSSGMARKRR